MELSMEVSTLSHRKESTLPLDTEDLPSEPRILTDHVYPFAMVLRLRVLQIVCGISSLVMGTVAFIEERGRINLGLGMPAGIFTVIAAAVSIHTSRGFGGYKPASCGPRLRFLGPNVAVAIPSTLLWGSACLLHSGLVVTSATALVTNPQLTLLSCVLLTLASLTLAAVITLLVIDCRYDPD